MIIHQLMIHEIKKGSTKQFSSKRLDKMTAGGACGLSRSNSFAGGKRPAGDTLRCTLRAVHAAALCIPSSFSSLRFLDGRQPARNGRNCPWGMNEVMTNLIMQFPIRFWSFLNRPPTTQHSPPPTPSRATGGDGRYGWGSKD